MCCFIRCNKFWNQRRVRKYNSNYFLYRAIKWKDTIDEVVAFLDGGKLPFLLVENKADLLGDDDEDKAQLEEFGKNTFRVTSHPTWIKEGTEDDSIRKIFELVGEFKDKFDKAKFNDRVAATLACKSSVKGNTYITYEEQEALINNLFKCKFPYTCPHGRPTIIKYTKYDLEKMFKRALD